ncbi:MAG: SDR family NAD(P)-dependent oxidoreductase, partial [Mesorhizobium sp.]
MNNLFGRSAIVTGGFSGMGFAIATALAEAGANVAVGSYIAPAGADRSDAAYYPGADEIGRVRAALAAHGTRVHAAHLDVRDSDVANRFAADAEVAIGPADILVNAAGTTAEQPVCGH